MKIDALFALLITVQFVVVVSHDWLDIPGWTHGRQVQELIGRSKLLWATAINAVFPGLAVAFAVWFWGKSQPRFVSNYWAVYCGITLVSAAAMCYVPYFLGTDEKKKLEYSRMYAGTRHVIPARGDNPRPNLLHVFFRLLICGEFRFGTGHPIPDNSETIPQSQILCGQWQLYLPPWPGLRHVLAKKPQARFE